MDSMLSKALRDFMSGPLKQLLVNLAGEDGAAWEAELKRFNRKEPCWRSEPRIAHAPMFDFSFELVVDYREDLEQMIAAGHYYSKNSDITSRQFPIRGEGKVEFEGKLFFFNRKMSPEEARRKIKSADKRNPWTVAKIEHLLAFGKKYPDVHRKKYPIIALDSAVEINGVRYVPCLSLDGLERRLDLRGGLVEDYSTPRDGFLAVRQIGSET